MSPTDPASSKPVRARTMAGIVILALFTGCATSKKQPTQRTGQAQVAAHQAQTEALASQRSYTAQYIQNATFQFGQVWQQFLNQYGDRLLPGSRVVTVIEVTREGQVAGLRFEQPTPDADLLERGIETTLSVTQFDPFPDEMQRELGPTASVQLRIPIQGPANRQ